jgi:riboflavin kinase
VEIQPIERNKLRLLRQYGGECLKEFKAENRTFGEVRCYQANINGVSAAIVLPIRSHYSTTVEVIAPKFLRDQLNVKDGDEVEITVMLEK